MSSIIPGFEYDIFISCRQKDNKHDGWVTEFVDNLKGELESTFKEEIRSIRLLIEDPRSKQRGIFDSP
jgi:hypothetical protein